MVSMVEGFPEKGARLMLVREAGGVRAGSICVLVQSMTSRHEAPEDVFVVEHRGERLWILRRDLQPVDQRR